MLVCVGTYNRRVTIAVIALPLACIRGPGLLAVGFLRMRFGGLGRGAYLREDLLISEFYDVFKLI